MAILLPVHADLLAVAEEALTSGYILRNLFIDVITSPSCWIEVLVLRTLLGGEGGHDYHQVEPR